MYRDRPNYLFAGDNDLLAALEQAAVTKVRSEPDDAILDSDPDWLVSTIMVEGGAEPVVLEIDGATRDEPEETSVNVSGDPRYALFPGDDGNVPALLHRVRFPFTGFKPLLEQRPSTWYPM